jgi:glycosyltransferase involved in cell wall biosynthesis
MAARLKTGITIHSLDRTRRFDWIAMRQFARWIQQRRVDGIHSHGRTTFSFLAFMKTLGLIAQPLVMHDHTGKARPEVSAPLWFQWWARQHVAHYVGVCTEMDGWAERAGIPADRRSLIAGALDLHDERMDEPRAHNLAAPSLVAADLSALDSAAGFDERTEFRAPPGMLLGVCLGGVRPEKGIDTLLAAVAGGQRRGSFRIVVVGGVRDPNYWNACLSESERLGLHDDVVFAGERADAAAWLERFDFAIHAARSESGPLVLIEHLAAGLPLVCTRAGEIARRAEQLGVERFVPPGDAHSLSAAIDELVSLTPRERSERGGWGRRIAHRNFDIRAVMQAWHAVYEKATGKRFLLPPAAKTAA